MRRKRIEVLLGLCLFVSLFLLVACSADKEIETYTSNDEEIKLIVEEVLSKPDGDIDFVSVYYKRNDRHIKYRDIKYEGSESKKRTIISLKNLNWNRANEYYVYINFRERLYTTKVTKEDMGKSITINYNKNKYGKLQVSIPFAKDNYKVDDILVHHDTGEKNLKSVYTGAFNNNIDLPYGRYDIQVNAHDNENVYIFYKENVVIENDYSLIEFNRNDVAKLKIEIDYGEYDDAKLVLLSSSHKEGEFSKLTSLSSSSVKKIAEFDGLCVSKGKQDIYIHIRNQGWNYTLGKYLEVESDTKLNFNLDLQAKIEGEETKFQPGIELNRKIKPIFRFRDGYGNILININEPLNEVVEGIIEFKKGDKIERQNFDKLKDIKNISVPEETGDYEMTLKLIGGPIEIMSATKEIIIGWGEE
ncbi:hypothetical protein R9X47_25110 [Wukongibacter baidiensis]|uniref:hypothetical protein n=1 Tax=Wukongibacter baidiensis TaxID=1723361 RepID=UPI003D7FCA2D